jgi:hypothetical protein
MPISVRRPLLTYAFVSHSVATSQDFFLALTPLFGPIIGDMDGEIFDPRRFSERVKQYYGLSMNPAVAEEFIPRLVKVGMLTVGAESKEHGIYRCVHKEEVSTTSKEWKRVEKTITTATEDFNHFLESLNTLFSLNYTHERLEEILLDWLVRSDASVGEAERVLLSDETPDDDNKRKSTFEKEDDYLCARFIYHLSETNSDLLDELAKISSGAMVSEVILDLRKPPEADRKARDLVIFLDAPFMMDVLNLTGKDRHNSSIYIFNSLKKMEARLALFEHSSEEIRSNLAAILNLPSFERTGPTADALRKGEVLEDYARDVLRDAERHVSEAGVGLSNYSAVRFPKEEPYFDQQRVNGIAGQLYGWQSWKARERDAESITFVMRRRRGRQTSDVFESRYVLLSHNPVLCRRAWRFCVDEGLIQQHQVGPAVHQRRMAALLWVTVGMEERAQLSRRQLVANCTRALASRPDVISAMRSTLAKVKPAVKDQFDALLTRHRSVQLAMELTLGVKSVVSEKNIETIFEDIKKSTSEEERKIYEKKIRDEKVKFKAQVFEKETEISDLSQQTSALRNQVEDALENDRRLIRDWVVRAQKRGNLFVNAAKLLFTLATMAVLGVGAWAAQTWMGPLWNWLVAIFSAAIIIIPAWMHVPGLLRARIVRDKDRTIKQWAEQAGRSDLLTFVDINWETDEIVWRGKYDPKRGEQESNLL